jgi:rod shape-determining protein MreC
MPTKHHRLFFILLAVSVLLMTYQSRTAPIRPFGFIPSSVNYVNVFVDTVEDAARDTRGKITMYEQDLNDLRAEVRRLRLNQQTYKEAMLENQRLREALSLKEREPMYVATTRVISRGFDRWSNTFVIDKGEEEGIGNDMAAVTHEGLLGKVIQVDRSFSKVLLLDDPRFSVAVRLEGGRSEAVLSGAGRRRCTLKYVGVDTGVKPGEVVITSGLDGLFPHGVRAGTVYSVSTDERELFHEIEVIPFVDSHKVEEVTIITR